MEAKHLIVIDGDPEALGATSDLLSQHNFVVVGEAQNLTDAIQLLSGARFDCAVVDLNLFGEDIAPLVGQLQAARKCFVLTTGLFPYELRSPWLLDLPILTKPFDGATLIKAIEQVLAG